MASKLIVVKVGTTGITTENGKFDDKQIENLAYQICAATKNGF